MVFPQCKKLVFVYTVTAPPPPPYPRSTNPPPCSFNNDGNNTRDNLTILIFLWFFCNRNPTNIEIYSSKGIIA